MAPKTWGVRCYATVKPDIKLLKQLRVETEISMSKAKEALIQTNNNYDEALAWLLKEAQVSGAKKALKVADRAASEGLITTASVEVPVQNGLKSKSVIIELNCETDFVSKNDVFKNLASRIAATSLLMHETQNTAGRALEAISIPDLLQAPLMPHSETGSPMDISSSVQESIVEAVGKLGENIGLRRAAITASGISATYVHGGSAGSGKIGGVAVLQPKNVTLAELEEKTSAALLKTARQVARQVVGFNPAYLHASDVPQAERDGSSSPETFDETHVLTLQKYMLKPDLTIAEFVHQEAVAHGLKDGAEVVDFVRWEVAGDMEKQ
ncbi:elongation factor TS-domain-containing protein [Sporodiniella umbellata]|nr:elongation factor TS-domain-containing protein [Sporodiniella umbellata]